MKQTMQDQPQQSNSAVSTKAGLPLLDKELLESCIHCGLCLPACPTYQVSGLEAESPRGRIYLLNMLRTGQIQTDDPALNHIDTCLGCMGCQTACPSGVKYQKILNQARPALADALPRENTQRRWMRWAFAKLLPNYGLLRFGGSMFRVLQQLGLTRLRPTVPLAPKLTARLREWQKFLPVVPSRENLSRVYAPNTTPGTASEQSSKQGTPDTQLFSGCVMDILYNNVNHASVQLLNRQGRCVGVPEQTCCGALAAHAGELDIARILARKNIEHFEDTAGDIAVTSAGCGAMLKEYAELLEHDPEWHERALKFSARVKDITEVLVKGNFLNGKPKMTTTIAYHAACHLSHVQKVKDPPLRLLSMIEGAKLVALEEQEHCCGSAGIYNLMHTETSLEVLDRKMRFIEKTGASVIATGNPGCLLQIEAGAKMRGLPLRVVHPVELLNEAF